MSPPSIRTYTLTTIFFLNFPTESLKAPKSPPSPPCNNPPLQTKAGKWRSGVKERCCSRFRRDCWTWTITCFVLDFVNIVEHLLKDKTLQIWGFARASHRTSFLLWHTSIKVVSEKWKVFGLSWNISKDKKLHKRPAKQIVSGWARTRLSHYLLFASVACWRT